MIRPFSRAQSFFIGLAFGFGVSCFSLWTFVPGFTAAYLWLIAAMASLAFAKLSK